MAFRSLLVMAIFSLMFELRPAVAADISQCFMVAEGRAQVVDIAAQLDDGREMSVQGILHQPSGVGPFPAVIMLHGDGSLYTPYCHGALAKQFAAWGYATLIVASSTGRDGAGNRYLDYSFKDQANYARGAVRVLEKVPDIDGNRLGVWGHSRGGLTAIELATNPGELEAPFRAIVTIAPHCPAKVVAQHAPLLLMVGTKDPKISVSACKDFAAGSGDQANFQSLFLEGGDHLFWLQPNLARVSADRMRVFLKKHLDDPSRG